MKKILVIGSLNMDMVTKVRETPIAGETILGSDIQLIPGGKGANQAATIGKLKGNVTMLGMVGDDNYGDTLLHELISINVETKYISKNDESSTGIAFIMINDNGNNSIVVIPGANNKLEKSMVDELDIESFDILVAQMEIPVEIIEYTFEKAKSAGLYTVLNPAPAQELSDQLIKNIDLLIPNETEFEVLTGYDTSNENNMKAGVDYLKDKGVKEILITLGADGAGYFGETNEIAQYKSYAVDVVDTTAAGDSFIGAVTTALSQGSNMHDAIEFATKVAAITVGKLGAQVSIPTLEMVKEFNGKKRQ